MRLAQLLPFLCLTACAEPAAHAAASPIFDPIAFFTGRTEGRGRLKILWHAAKPIVVHGSGRVDPDGSLILDQRIEREGHSPEQRQWHIRRASGGYSATLNTAQGPVAVSVEGNLLRLDLGLDGLKAHQDIFLSADGRAALNHMRMSKFGIRVATIEERITKLDGSAQR